MYEWPTVDEATIHAAHMRRTAGYMILHVLGGSATGGEQVRT